MKNLWKKSFVAEERVDTAKDIIQEQCNYLRSSTGGKIIAKIIEYNGATESYLLMPQKESTSKVIDIQKKLGENMQMGFSFEFFITSTATPNYKYRIMFVKYGISLYPVHITLDESIASEIDKEEHIICDSQEEFEATLELILNSSKLEKIINNLLAIAKQQG